MARRMADPAFRKAQWNSRWEPHIDPINGFVDALRKRNPERGMPYVAPLYGGVNAELLNVLQDPGEMTKEGIGSGFVCLENDDQTAERLCNFLAENSIHPSRTMAWNAYPWYTQKGAKTPKEPNAGQLRIGAQVLVELVALLPRLKVIMLNGGAAQSAWKYAINQGLNLSPDVEVIPTLHTSRGALRHPDPAVQEDRQQRLAASFRDAATYLGDSVGEAEA